MQKFRDQLDHARDRPQAEFLEIADKIFESIKDATREAFFVTFTNRTGHQPSVEDWYRFDAAVTKNLIRSHTIDD